MNNRVKRILGIHTPLCKKADAGSMLANLANASKDTILLTMAVAAAGGAGIGWVAEKITSPVEDDFENARNSYAVGNLKANVMSNVNKLRAERMKVTDKKQKALRLV